MAAAIGASGSVATLEGLTMGTSWRVKLNLPGNRDLHPLYAGVEQRLDTVVRQMSTWEADSDISRFNRAPSGTWQQLPDECFEVLECALAVARDSGGAYDPCIGLLVTLWGFGAHARSDACTRTPDASTLSAARALCGWQRLRIDPDRQRIGQPGGLQLDLSAIAKGYAVDRVAGFLREHGITGALVEVGGELYGFGGKPDGSPWRVLVESALEQADRTACIVDLDGTAIATSGDRWHRYEHAGAMHSHSIDPRTGTPVRHGLRAASVLSGSAMLADAWATAMTILGPTDGIALARQERLAVRMVATTAHGLDVLCTPAFETRMAAA